MRTVSRLASPGGFALVLLLFLVLPFLSVSCELPTGGSIGVDYTGAQLVTGAEPDVEAPQEWKDMTEDLADPESTSTEEAPDPGVQVLAVIAGVVLLLGIVLPFLPGLRQRARPRLLTGAVVAVVAGGLLIVVQAVAQSNLTDELQRETQDTSDTPPGMPDMSAMVGDMTKTEIGFWLSVIGLGLIAVLSLGFAYRDRIMPTRATTAAWPGAEGTMWPPGQPPTGQPPTGQPPTEQPPTSEPASGQPPTDQPPTDQPPPGQPPRDQPPAG